MILTFSSKATEQLWLGRRPAELPPSIRRVALRKLTQLHAIQTLDELLVPPGNRLETLKGDRKGQHSIRVSDQYRVCFVWDGTNAREVEVVDYH